MERIELRLETIALLVGTGVCMGVQAQGPGGPGGSGGRQQPRLVLQALDTDHDGTLSAAEIAAAPASLLKLDINGDGMLTADELTGRPLNAGASSSELAKQLMSFDKTGKGYLVAEDLPERMRGLFTRADSNHDGKLTPDEIGAVSAKQSMPVGRAPAAGRAEGMFRMDPLLNALDTNHDGILSADEIAAASASLKTLDRNGDGQITPDEMPVRQMNAEERADHMLDEWDTNKDGKLSKAEAPERMAAQFDQIDADHDGFLSKAELVAYFKTQGNGAPRSGVPGSAPGSGGTPGGGGQRPQ